MAIDAEDRCKQYQTSSPYRDYTLQYKKFFTNRSKAEQEVHKILINKDGKIQNTYLSITKPTSKKITNEIINSFKLNFFWYLTNDDKNLAFNLPKS